MKKLLLLTIILSACNFVCAQKTYTVGVFWLSFKNGQTVSYFAPAEPYIILSIDSEGKGNYEYIDSYGERKERFTEDEIDYIYCKTSQIYDVSDEERAALMDLYNATDGPHWWHNEGWGEDVPVSQWYGIGVSGKSINDGSHVTRIELANNGLSGTIPSSIKALSSLVYLSLYTSNIMPGPPNKLTGTLPAELATLTELKNLFVSGNKLSGDFPEHPISELMNQMNSAGFNFANNNFTVPFPEWVKNHDKFGDYWPQFCVQDSYTDSGCDWDQFYQDLYIPGPKYLVTDLNGNKHKYSDDYANNKLTILYNYTSWCPYSKALTPKLVNAYDRYKDAGLKVIGFVDFYNDTSEDISRYIENYGITWPNVSWGGVSTTASWDDEGHNTITSMYNGTTPVVCAINQQGELVHPFLKPNDNLISIIEQMFGPVDAFYTSTDYSRDGEVIKLQSATEGKGIDIVFLGDAFVDKDMDPNGKYEQKMREAMEQFFSEEPYTTMRNRFNVYTVKVVSPNAEFINSCTQHALQENDSKVFEYAQKAIGENADRMMVGVIYNTDYYINRSYCNMYLADGSFVAYIKDNIGSVLNHEMGGHGVAQLKDEYVENGYENLTIPEESKKEMDEMWQKYGAGANVDYHSDAADVKWAHFINDNRYADEVGIYEGAYLYGYGAYRPSENSMMRYNDSPFNAPSRESIYKHVMTYSENNWNYDYENFVAFDAPIRESIKQQQTTRRAQNKDKGTSLHINTLPPTIYKGTWQSPGQKIMGKGF